METEEELQEKFDNLNRRVGFNIGARAERVLFLNLILQVLASVGPDARALEFAGKLQELLEKTPYSSLD